MLTPEEFPYIKSLHVNDCYAYQDFDIDLHDYKPFSHLILTGKNGSGKSTILRNIDNYVSAWLAIVQPMTNHSKLKDHITQVESIIKHIDTTGNNKNTIEKWEQELLKYNKLSISIPLESELFWKNNRAVVLYSFFKAKRTSQTMRVDNPSKESEFSEKLNTPNSTDFFISKFKQYLVNRKVEQAFSQIENRIEQVNNVNLLFDKLTESFDELFERNLNSIDFDHKNYEFYLHLTDGRKLTFDTLSEGFSAFISILMDLFMRVDLIRKQVDDYSYDPCGIVLIDEPETHLHLQLQEQILPLLIRFFPNIQFIAATHSPAVIASIKNATIFDLTTKQSRISEETAGRSYSDLMMSHFELNNEYSAIADEIINQVDRAVAEYGSDPERLREVLKPIYDANSDFLSPTLKVKFELLMAQQDAKALTHS